MILNKAKVVLGVTGGIAAYKAVEICSRLVQSGAEVDVIMTEAATHFVPPLPFQTITQRPVNYCANLSLTYRLKRKDPAPGKQRGVDLKRRVFSSSTNQGNGTVLNER